MITRLHCTAFKYWYWVVFKRILPGSLEEGHIWNMSNSISVSAVHYNECLNFVSQEV